MCNARTLTSNVEAIRQQFRFEVNRVGNMPLLPSIWPGQDSPVVRRADQDARELVSMSWGFVLPQKGRAAKRVTNARDDKLASSPFWRGSFEERRCLVPTSSFCEWNAGKPKVPHWFGLKGDEPRPAVCARRDLAPLEGRPQRRRGGPRDDGGGDRHGRAPMRL